MLRTHLDPEEVPSVSVLLLTEEPPLQPDGPIQLVLDLQVRVKHEHFGGLTLPVVVVSA